MRHRHLLKPMLDFLNNLKHLRLLHFVLVLEKLVEYYHFHLMRLNRHRLHRLLSRHLFQHFEVFLDKFHLLNHPFRHLLM